MGLSEFHSPTRKKYMKPFKGINKKIHEITGKIFPGGDVKNPPEGKKSGCAYRQVGKTPGDKSGFGVQHLGDHK